LLGKWLADLLPGWHATIAGFAGCHGFLDWLARWLAVFAGLLICWTCGVPGFLAGLAVVSGWLLFLTCWLAA
jgi:hypothetical protein